MARLPASMLVGRYFVIYSSADGSACFIAFDLLYLNGKDLRPLPLIEIKAMSKKLLGRKRPRILYLDHVEGDGRLLFDQIVAMDLEGIVCKRKDSPYKVTEKPSRYWIKVKNSATPNRNDVKNSLSACDTLVRGRSLF